MVRRVTAAGMLRDGSEGMSKKLPWNGQVRPLTGCGRNNEVHDGKDTPGGM